MSTTVLLLLAVAAIALLLVLVIKARMSAFVAMLLVSLLLALVTGVPLGKVVKTLTDGMGSTLGSVAIVVGLGAMLGAVIEAADGARTLAERFTAVLGRHRVAAAITAAAFILGIPIFFDVGFIILAPIVFGFAAVTGTKLLRIALPVAAVMLTVHVVVPPHPGPVAAAATLNGDVGLVTLVALPVCAVVGVVGYLASKVMKTDEIVLGDTPIGNQVADHDVTTIDTHASGHTGTGTVVALILTPILLIMIGTVGKQFSTAGTLTADVLGLVGSPLVALMVAVLLAYLVIGHQQGWDLGTRGQILDSALPNVAVIVFVTGAGGVLASVLVASGVGKALSDALVAAHLPLLLTAFVISLALRASQGSATVAILTTAGLLSNSVATGGHSSLQVALVLMAIGFGALGLSHINDSGFWIVTKYTGLTVKDGLKTWTVLSTICGLTGFLITCVLWAIVS
ncbi:GntP family transporter [Acidipropionibacterium timonense]|uniref:GntP family transporter n=1 Tax=Acidipropionibacterium timonense TaxID=2161818 RepID=UPI00102F8123|nr:GntP family transporter [Acidipropionibacterium timonense]